MPNPKPVLHRDDHRPQSRLEDGTRGGADALRGIDSTGNAGDWGVQSVDSDGVAEDEGLVLTSDGLGGSTWEETEAGGDGIQFSTDPQEGDFLVITTTNDLGITVGGEFQVDSEGKAILTSTYTSSGPSDPAIRLQSSDGYVAIEAAEHVLLNGEGITITSASVLGGHADGAVVLSVGNDPLEGNRYFRINDGDGDALLVVDDAGTYHIRSGASWATDL